MNRQQNAWAIALFLAASLICWLVRQEPFFWDTIQLGARHALWFYDHNFSSILLPDNMDSGHIPFFGAYLATCWRIFGQNILISHFAMLPWLFLLLWQLYLLVRRLGQGQFVIWGVLLFLADPTLLAQMTLMSPDVLLVGGFLLALNSIETRNHLLLTLAILLLGLTSLRGMMLGIGLFTWQLLLLAPRYNKKTMIWQMSKALLPYLPGGLFCLAYLAYHYQIKGWLGVHEDSPWSASFVSTNGWGYLRQLAIVVWRTIDFGRVFLWLGMAVAYWWVRPKWSARWRRYTLLALTMGLVLGLPAILSPGLAQHRYLLPFFLSVTILAALLFQQIIDLQHRKILYAIVVVGLISGHSWIYPTSIAQGWDASLAHKPYFEGIKNSKEFLNEENISLNKTMTTFPSVGPRNWRELNEENNGFVATSAAPTRYVLYSNVTNDFSDQFVAKLAQLSPIFTFEKRGIFIHIYELPN